MVPKPSGTYEVSRAVQRAAPPASTSAPSSLANDDAEGLRRAAVHHWRARMMVKLSSLYADAAWDAQEKPDQQTRFGRNSSVTPVSLEDLGLHKM